MEEKSSRMRKVDTSVKKTSKRLMNLVLTLVLVGGLTAFGISEYNNYRSRLDYEAAVEVALSTREETEPTEDPEVLAWEEAQRIRQEMLDKAAAVLESDPNIRSLLEIDLEALREVNEDVIGWIRIPDTKIDYPLLQWTDNQFYLTHTWKQVGNGSGSIFMECNNKSDFSDFNTIIYGHNMRNKSMFGSLQDYRNPKHVESHPYIYIVNDTGILRYDIFAMHRAGIDSIMYGLKIDSEQKKTEFIRFAKDYSQIDTDIEPTPEDKILTLSTCSGAGYGTRWIVQGVWNADASYILPNF